jgi:hypothetical protein
VLAAAAQANIMHASYGVHVAPHRSMHAYQASAGCAFVSSTSWLPHIFLRDLLLQGLGVYGIDAVA